MPFFCGIVRAMKAVIDGRLETELGSTPMQLKTRSIGLVAVPGGKLPRLTIEQVRDTLERVRR